MQTLNQSRNRYYSLEDFIQTWSLNLYQNCPEKFHIFPDKTIIFNDNDPSWFNSEIKSILIKKDETFQQYVINRKPQNNNE